MRGGSCSEEVCLEELDAFDIRELGKARGEVIVAVLLEEHLVRPLAARCTFTISTVELVDDVHALSDLPDGREAAAVQKRIVVGVDEELRRPRVGAARREHQRTAFIGDFNGVILEAAAAPLGHDIGVAIDAELADEAGENTEEAAALEEGRLAELLEPRRAQGRPAGMHLGGGREQW